MESPRYIACRCKVENGKIIFCPFHESTGRLLAACSYARQIFSGLKSLQETDANLIREVVLPHLDSVIAGTEKKIT